MTFGCWSVYVRMVKKDLYDFKIRLVPISDSSTNFLCILTPFVLLPVLGKCNHFGIYISPMEYLLCGMKQRLVKFIKTCNLSAKRRSIPFLQYCG